MSILDWLQRETAGVSSFGAGILCDGRTVLNAHADLPLCACSTAKVVVAMAVMTLVDDGVLALDTPVGAMDADLAFPDRADATRITLRHLLSHTSGLDDTLDVEPDPRAALRHLSVIAEPGRVFRYSNLAFDIAHEVAARVAGVDPFTLLHERVLAPLGMTATRPSTRFPRGVLETTARDLVRLAEDIVAERRVLSERSYAAMARVHTDSYTAAPARYYGLGLVIEQWENRMLLSHGGGLGRYGSAFVVDPEARAAAAFLFDDPAGYAVSAHALLDATLARQTHHRSRRDSNVDLEPYLGVYSNGATLSEERGHLVVEWKGKRTTLAPVDERVFAGPGRISVGLLPGEPTMISVNDFILIGARPGTLRNR